MPELFTQMEEQMQSLKLKAMSAAYRSFSERAAKSKLGYEEYLALLLEEEVRARLDRSLQTKINQAKFPFIKTLEAFDFSFQPGVPEKELLRLSSLEFLETKENLVFLGPPGVGKTHLAIGFGLKACSVKHRVLFTTARDLLDELMIALKQGILTGKLLTYSRLNLLIIDELGYVPVTKEQANVFFQLVSMRYEKGSMILTSNYGFEDWGKIFPDPVVAAAILDRLVHHAKIFFIRGSSYRLKDKLRKSDLNGNEEAGDSRRKTRKLNETESKTEN